MSASDPRRLLGLLPGARAALLTAVATLAVLPLLLAVLAGGAGAAAPGLLGWSAAGSSCGAMTAMALQPLFLEAPAGLEPLSHAVEAPATYVGAEAPSRPPAPTPLRL